jgi:hypothetical protein
VIQIGGTKCTSREALQRFFDRLSNVSAGMVENAFASPSQERLDRVDQQLDESWNKDTRVPQAVAAE